MTQKLNTSYITVIPNSGHRIGHKLDDLITGFILAEWHNLKYLHSPLPQGKWEDFFGFGEDEIIFSEDFRKDLPIISCTPFLGIRHLNPQSRFAIRHIEWLEYRVHSTLKKSPIKELRQWRRPNFWDGSPLEYFEKIFNQDNKNREVIFCFQKGIRVMLYQIYDWGRQGKIDPNLYSRVIQKLKRKYFGKKHSMKKCYFNPDAINIAVHIRRDDASVENQRFLPLSYYKALLSKLNRLIKSDFHEFHIYSSGSEKEMNSLKRELHSISSNNLIFHCNEPAMEAIHHMAVADILVIGNSSFSHWPGFLSSGIKFYYPHFHMFNLDKSEWITVDIGGEFDEFHFSSLFSKYTKDFPASRCLQQVE
ncbi:hypothetical protein XM38_005520 [Halomicronema hongdechloris C2206]|uniref:Uncharacterized protein n=1 Tax=Halomicronema hongdechloris C2206 TaxID=1641165 RepID=A0A1Z3HH57_9CYAN|nr:hypothetical protein [Halomicronema hongdechloris]ASC69624.1 hypothetical protein XM38_005520 [Halomicronema hongdechloris C2206]